MSTDRIGTKAENLNGSEKKSTEAMLELSTNLKRKNRRRAIDSIFICRYAKSLPRHTRGPACKGTANSFGNCFTRYVCKKRREDTNMKCYELEWLENPIVEPSFWPEIPSIVSPDGKPFAQEANKCQLFVSSAILGPDVFVVRGACTYNCRGQNDKATGLFKHMVVEHLHDHILIRGRKTKKSEESRDFPGREQIQFGDVVQAPPKLTAPSKIY
ncbi:LOW QUALITY PROTEIN: hypothetical protein NC653_032672 [Populus alba x Populus x berolinensis]|uniref:Uncharacterized protein n=1 Tax=Populus alba x Populus x berolinensis TaxID=444605 RepID=A0AAD6LRZ8_9ROSI|nr:LOW QUALITY PROTEIN: hypothetical protein NC653_032672 [Populus alba x Populus x berolinensis]